MNELESERRLFERVSTDFPGTYSIEKSENAKKLRCVNLSGEGALIHTDHPMPEDAALQLNLRSDLVKFPIKISARLIWQKEIHSGSWQAGIKFDELKLLNLWPFFEKGEI